MDISGETGQLRTCLGPGGVNQLAGSSRDIESENNDETAMGFHFISFKNCRCQKTYVISTVKFVLFAVYLVYFVYCLTVEFGSEGSWRLVICTALGIILYVWRFFTKTASYSALKSVFQAETLRQGSRLRKITRWMLYILVSAFIVVYTTLAVLESGLQSLVSLSGIAVFTVGLFLTSKNRSKIEWHTVFWGFALQVFLAIIVLRTDFGAKTVQWVSDRLLEFMNHTNKASAFVIGPEFIKFRIIFVALPQVIFFCAAIGVLTYLGALQYINYHIGSLLGFVTGTSAGEAMNAATNMFLGSAEAMYIIKSYMEQMDESQIFCVLVNGLAAIGGTVIVVFAGYGIPAKYLIAASVMSAPAALAAAKMSVPSTKDDDHLTNNDLELEVKVENGEIPNPSPLPTEKDMRKLRKEQLYARKEKSVIEAFMNGAFKGFELVKVIVVTMIVILSVLEFADQTVQWFGHRAGMDKLTLEVVLGYVFYPCAFVMGIELPDCYRIAKFLGLRAISNPGVAYIPFADIIANRPIYENYTMSYNDSYWINDDLHLPNWNTTLQGGVFSKRSEVIGVYALCGFASFQMAGNSMGMFQVIAPKQMSKVSGLIVRAFAVATIACYWTACVAGLLYSDSYEV